MRKLILIGLLGASLPAQGDTIIFAGGAFTRLSTTIQVPVTDVVGQANSAAADALLELDGLDLGNVTETCSIVADDVVIDQDPNAGESVNEGSLVDVTVSDGTTCPGGNIRPRLGRGI